MLFVGQISKVSTIPCSQASVSVIRPVSGLNFGFCTFLRFVVCEYVVHVCNFVTIYETLWHLHCLIERELQCAVGHPKQVRSKTPENWV